MDIEKFSRQVIDTYERKAAGTNAEVARHQTIAEHSQAASQRGELHASNAAQVARSSIDNFREKTADGMERQDAAKATARETAERFDSAGRDTQRRERIRDGLSL